MGLRFAVALVLAGCASSSDGFRPSEWSDPFSVWGHPWQTRVGGPTGPGNNRWMRAEVSEESIVLRVDDRSTEITTPLPPPPVEVVVELEGDLHTLDPSVVLGVFLYRNDTSEVDFEVTRWGDPDADNAQVVIAPARPERMWRFPLEVSERTLVRFRWRARTIEVEVEQDGVRRRWRRASSLEPALHRLHLNLWRRTPADTPAEVRVTNVAIRRLR
ncbi:MAG: hypothetical protein AAGE52_42115 [Myxococcota bacterium]